MTFQKVVLIIGLVFFVSPKMYGDAISNTSNNTLKISLPYGPLTIDPHYVANEIEEMIARELFEGLFTSDHHGNLQLGIAESFSSSEDCRRLEFSIRSNARWQNGDPVTAKDFVASWKRLLDPAFKTRNASFGKYLETFKAVNDKKLEVTLKIPNPATGTDSESCQERVSRLFYHPAFAPLHQTTIKHFASKLITARTKKVDMDAIVANGAFILESIKRPDIVLSKNAQYWDNETVTLQQVKFTTTPNEWAEKRSMLEERFDLAFYRVRPVVPEEDMEQHTLIESAGWQLYFLLTNAAFASEEIKRLLSTVVDREGLVNVARGMPSPLTDEEAVSRSPAKKECVLCDRPSIPRPPMTEIWSGNGRMAPARGLFLQSDFLDAGRNWMPTHNFKFGECKPSVNESLLEEVRSQWDMVTIDLGPDYHPNLIINRGSDFHKRLALDFQRFSTYLRTDNNDTFGVVIEAEDWKEYQGQIQSREFNMALVMANFDSTDPLDIVRLQKLLQAGGFEGLANEVEELSRDTTIESSQFLDLVDEIVVGSGAIIPLIFVKPTIIVSKKVAGVYANPLDFHPLKHVSIR